MNDQLYVDELKRYNEQAYLHNPYALGPPWNEYKNRFNLDAELGALRLKHGNQLAVWDVCCGTGLPLYGLVSEYPDCQVVGVDASDLPTPKNALVQPEAQNKITKLHGLMEDLDSSILKKAKEKMLRRPNLVLLSNGLKYSLERGTLDRTLTALHNLVQSGETVLIYEDLGVGLYPIYLQALKKISLPFLIEEINTKASRCKSYLRLTKLDKPTNVFPATALNYPVTAGSLSTLTT